MKKLATKEQAWKSKQGNYFKHENDAEQDTAKHLLIDLSRRIERAQPSINSVTNSAPHKAKNAAFLTAAAWFKEHPELVKKLTNYKLSELEAKSVGSTYAPNSTKQISEGPLPIKHKDHEMGESKIIPDTQLKQALENARVKAGFIPDSTSDEDLLDYVNNRRVENPDAKFGTERYLEYRQRVGKSTVKG